MGKKDIENAVHQLENPEDDYDAAPVQQPSSAGSLCPPGWPFCIQIVSNDGTNRNPVSAMMTLPLQWFRLMFYPWSMVMPLAFMARNAAEPPETAANEAGLRKRQRFF